MDRDFLLADVWILFPNFDFLDQGYRQFSGKCVQLQKLSGFLHQILLFIWLLLLSQFFSNLSQSQFQSAFLCKEILVQIHELPFAQNARNLIQIQVLQSKTPLFQLDHQGFLLLQQHIPLGILGLFKLQLLQGIIALDIVPQPLQYQVNQSIQSDGVTGTKLFLPAVSVQLASEIVDALCPPFSHWTSCSCYCRRPCTSLVRLRDERFIRLPCKALYKFGKM